MNLLRSIAESVLARADVRLDGPRAWDIRVHDARFFRRVALHGSIGFGEAYVDGWWSTDDLEGLAARIASLRLEEIAEWLPRGFALNVGALLMNAQTRRGATRVARQHYDFDQEIFAAFLGETMNYSCAYYRDTDDLDQAQRMKLELICQKLDLKRGDHLLDVGGGWGGLAEHAARAYGARVTSINISEEQMRYARERCRGLDVEIVRCDYRDVRGSFDKVAAIAMFTHVGPHNYRTFMKSIERVLKPEGTFLIEGVWNNVSTPRVDAWIDKYIFPGATMPSGAQTFRAFEGVFVAEDVHNFGPDYEKTLRAWNDRFQRAWPELRKRHDERLRKTFEYFFLTIAGYFRARALQHWHLVLTRPGAAQPATCRITDVAPPSREERTSSIAELHPAYVASKVG